MPIVADRRAASSRPRLALLARLAPAWLALACAAEPSAGDPYAAMPRLALVPESGLCIGDGAEGCQFVDVTIAAVGPDGRVALAGARDEVMQFDADGRFVRRIGQRGRGPGEYGAVMAATYDASATLTLFDAAGWRLVRFDSAGRPLGASTPVEPPPGVQDAAFAGGRLVFFVLPGGAAVGDSVTARFVGVDDEGAATVTLGAAPARALATGDGTLVPVLPPFTPRPRWSAAPDGAIHFAEGGPLRIVRADGAAARVVVDLPVEPPAVTPAELDSARAVLLRVRGGPPLPPQARAAAEEAGTRAERRHPMVSALVAVEGGTVWAREARASVPDSVRWNGFAADGRPIGHLLLPVRSRILAGTRDRLLVVTHDADDVPAVRWHALREAR